MNFEVTFPIPFTIRPTLGSKWLDDHEIFMAELFQIVLWA